MYEQVYETLLEVFGNQRIAVCCDCLTVGTFDSLTSGSCPACGSDEEDIICVFEDVELLVGCLEAQDVNIHGVEIFEGEDAMFAEMNLCYVDLFSNEANTCLPTFMSSLGIA